MFDIGWPELLVVAIVLIIVVGPKDLPAMLRAFGRTTTKLREMAGEFRGQFDEALKEADLDEVRKTINEARSLNPMNQIRDAVNPLKQAGDDIKKNLKDSVLRDKPADKVDNKSAAKSEGETTEKATKADKPFVVPESGLKLTGDAPKFDSPAPRTTATDSAPVKALAAKSAKKPTVNPAAKPKAKVASSASTAKSPAKAAAAKPVTAAKTRAKASSPGKTTAKSAAATKAASKKGQA